MQRTLWCTDLPFSDAELDTLRAAGIVFVADRVVTGAQPPITDDDLARVEELVGAPVPEQLRELWAFTAGGRLAYELWVMHGSVPEEISVTELFYPRSDGYRDLLGWVEEQREFTEQEVADRGITDWDGVLPAVPFAGFEYLDRLFVDVRGETRGQVVARREATPGRWPGSDVPLEEVFTSDLPAAFRLLFWSEDPRTPISEFPSGLDLLEELEDCDLPEGLAERVVAYAARAVPDFRAALDDGSIVGDARTWAVAFLHAYSTDDAALARRLVAFQTDRDPWPLLRALREGAYAVATVLLDAGWAPQAGFLHHVRPKVPAEIAVRLAERGAVVDAAALAELVSEHGTDVADAVRQFAACSRRDIAQACRARADEWRRVRGQRADDRVTMSDLSLEELDERIDRLRAYGRRWF